MFKKFFNQILTLLAIIILVAVAFTIISKINIPGNKGDNSMTKKIIREPAVAGVFYPGSKIDLETMINGFLENATDENQAGVPRILIVPHAGYAYSGQVAADSFIQLLVPGYTKAILIGPSHNFSVSSLVLSGATSWQTPLGEIEVDEANLELEKLEGFEINDDIHKPEHSLEVEIPFLQIMAPGLKIVPIIVGELNAKQRSNFVQVLDKYLDEQTVLIVSVDLSHYHPYDKAKELDSQSIQDILALDSQGILKDQIDAPWAVSAVLDLAKQKGYSPRLLNYANSGDVSGDKSKVVGYSAIAFYDLNLNTMIEENKKQEYYTEAEKQELLKVARTTIEMYLKDDKTYEPQTSNPKFKENRGVFVTLNKNHKLRGCIGYIEPIKPLIDSICDNAISAAVNDNRFLPVTEPELAGIKIEISILTESVPDTLENIIKDKKGVVLKQGNRGATYLPQVWKDLSDPDQFFQSLCLKAGLEANCYKDSSTQFLSYEAVVFSE